MSDADVIKGAEATITVEEYLGRKALVKTRPVKTYRHPELDSQLRETRTRNEARIIREARMAGVNTPCIYDIDLSECSIRMQYIEGVPVKDILNKDPSRRDTICAMIGHSVAKLHSAGICHGDLTTSNMILCGDELYLIDFSMGRLKADLEEIGVDLRLLERAFSSAHVGLEDSFEVLMDAYYSDIKDAKAVRKKLEDIKNRGRYT